MAFLELKKVDKYYGVHQAIKSIDLAIESGEFVVFVGPSGCGKSTLLRMIAGLETINSGTLNLDGVDITTLTPAKRDLAMVFQSYALYPHMTVKKNMAFALRLAKEPEQVIEAKVAEVAEKLGLTEYLERTPKALSGGQRQRVAIGRAIVRAPKVFLFDEPLSNLDAALRGQTRVEIARLHRELGATTIYVTHDQVEAMTLADRVVVLCDGLIEQVGTPLEIYDQPKTRFVAQFIGMPKMNIMSANLFTNTPKGVTEIGIRPEHLSFVEKGLLNGVVELLESLGNETLIHVRLLEDKAVEVIVRLYGRTPLRIEDTVSLSWKTESVHYFDKQGEAMSNNNST